MSIALEIKRKKVELLRVSSNKAGLELRIHELAEEIERIKEHVTISEAAEKRLAEEIAEMEKQG